MNAEADLGRIAAALKEAGAVLLSFFRSDNLVVEDKGHGDPVTEADRAANTALLSRLPEPGDGWLSEESVDDRARLTARRVWVVDPLDGTREFLSGIPEWCVSVGLVEDGEAVAGGVFNPAMNRMVLGAIGYGVTLNGRPAVPTALSVLQGATVLASRSEVKRGEWDLFQNAPFETRPCGSVAYKLAMVAAGLADATWTMVPKHEWDVAAGMALVRASGGRVWLPAGNRPRFNNASPKLPGVVATAPLLAEPIALFLGARAGCRED